MANSYNKNISRKIFEYLKIKIFDSSKIFFVSLKIYFLSASKDKLERERQHKPRLIRPLEEVMEEDHLASRSQETADRGQDMDTQEADRANKVTA